MLKKDMTKVEIEQALQGKGDFVQMDWLSGLLKQNLPLDKKKFVYEKLANIYEKKSMFRDAAKIYNGLAIASIKFSEKTIHHVKEAEFYIKAGDFNMADEAVKKATNETSTLERENIHATIKEFYKRQASAYEKAMRRSNAVRIYEKLLQMKITEVEREEIKKKLMAIYEKLGRLKEYFALKDNKTDTRNIGRR